MIALPGGVGTLSEMALMWAASQTESRPLPLVLLGECWPPIIQSLRENLVINERDLRLLRFAGEPADAVRELEAGLQEKRVGSGPWG
jgi:predicted Rossmann-fold nucleotide-binding protein